MIIFLEKIYHIHRNSRWQKNNMIFVLEPETVTFECCIIKIASAHRRSLCKILIITLYFKMYIFYIITGICSHSLKKKIMEEMMKNCDKFNVAVDQLLAYCYSNAYRQVIITVEFGYTFKIKQNKWKIQLRRKIFAYWNSISHKPIEHRVFFNARIWERKEQFSSIHLNSYSLSYNGKH